MRIIKQGCNPLFKSKKNRLIKQCRYRKILGTFESISFISVSSTKITQINLISFTVLINNRKEKPLPRDVEIYNILNLDLF